MGLGLNDETRLGCAGCGNHAWRRQYNSGGCCDFDADATEEERTSDD